MCVGDGMAKRSAILSKLNEVYRMLTQSCSSDGEMLDVGRSIHNIQMCVLGITMVQYNEIGGGVEYLDSHGLPHEYDMLYSVLDLARLRVYEVAGMVRSMSIAGRVDPRVIEGALDGLAFAKHIVISVISRMRELRNKLSEDVIKVWNDICEGERMERSIEAFKCIDKAIDMLYELRFIA